MRQAIAPLQLSLFDAPVDVPPPPRVTPVRPPTGSTPPSAAPPPAGAREAPLGGEMAWPEPPGARHGVQLGPHRVPYALTRVRRRSIGFSVGADGLAVRAPRWVGIADIEAALQSRGDWIVRKLSDQRERARRQAQARIEWRDGADLPFLGRTLRVRLDPRASGAVLEPAPDGTLLRLGLPADAAPARIRDAVQGWLQRQARRIFDERCAHFAARLGVRVRRLALSSATTRWGSASADGSVRLNWRLVHFAPALIDYVVAHELAHLREMNHSPAFWDVVRSVVPGYEQARARLRDGVVPSLD